jgi:hypothetical protein
MSFSILRKTVRATGGTETDEFAAKIKSVTSSTTVGAVFVYDTRNDSDSGAWRKKARGSWYYEDLNTATRGGRRSFPSVALIVADNASANTVTIYDLDDPAMPMWMVFNAHTAAWETNAAFVSTSTLTSIHALNGRMYVGGEYGLVEIDFLTEQQTNFRPISSTQRVRHKKSGAIVDRNDTSGQFKIIATPIANDNVNDVAAKIVEGSEIGALGLPIPTVAVACGSGSSGGVSIIHANGTVNNWTLSGSNILKVGFGNDNSLYASQGQYVVAFPQYTFHTTLSTAYLSSVSGGVSHYHNDVSGAGNNIQALIGNHADTNFFGAATNDGFAAGSNAGLSLVKRNNGNHQEGAVAYVTSSYNTGYMLGDIRFAGLANLTNLDRSVKGNTLHVNNTSGSDYVEEVAVATNAELKAYTNFKAGNYLSRASDTDFDFGTGDFSIMFWVKSAATGSYEDYIARTDSTLEAGDWAIEKSDTEKIVWYRYNGSAWAAILTSSASIGSQWQQLIAVRRSGKFYWYINGKLDSSATDANSYTPSGGSELQIGRRLDVALPATNASLSLVRLSATAPTPTQVKEIYEAEAPLFRAGAKCLLQASSDSVLDLSYDKTTDLLSVGHYGTTAGRTDFKNLEAVNTFDGSAHGWSVRTTNLLASNGGVIAQAKTAGTGGVLVDIPPFDVRGDTNIADTKSSNDGKIRFTGVTTDATPTVIGFVPISENERYTIRSKVSGQMYQDNDSYFIDAEEEKTFYRDIGSDVSFRSTNRKLVNESLSTLDVEVISTTGGSDSPASVVASDNYVMIKVTGSGSARMQWKAEVEVQRISEKTYER